MAHESDRSARSRGWSSTRSSSSCTLPSCIVTRPLTLAARRRKARAGVLTGEAAVTLGSESEGMVLGDMVNTASRIQSAAQPGSVLVGESTRWATDAAVVYEDAGVHELKGKAEPVPAYRLVRVGGQASIEPSHGTPFVGREVPVMLARVSGEAPEPRPGPTGMSCDFAHLMKSATIRK